MRLTLKYDGQPETAKIIDADSGIVLDGVRAFRIERKEPIGCDELTITVLIRRQVLPVDESPSADKA